MKNRSKLSIIVFITCLYGCNVKTNKESRQFENLTKTIALSKEGKVFVINSRSFYVLESKSENLFDERGFFISENYESEDMSESIVRAGIRSIIRRYNADSILRMDPTYIRREIEDIVRSNENSTEDFEIRFNAIMIEKIINQRDF
jgi:hypothetical protein